METVERAGATLLLCGACAVLLLGCDEETMAGFVATVGGLALVIIVLLLVVFFRREERLKRALRRTAAIPIASVRDGHVAKVVGTVELVGEPLTAPLTRRPCAWYVARVEEYRTEGDTTAWTEILREERSRPFAVRDATGSALVHDDNAQAAVVADRGQEIGTMDTPPAELRELLARRSCRPLQVVRWSEGVVEAGEVVAVRGIAKRTGRAGQGGVAGQGGPYRSPLETRILDLSGTQEVPLLVSDYLETRAGAADGATLPTAIPSGPAPAGARRRALLVDSDVAPAVHIRAVLEGIGLGVLVVSGVDTTLEVARSVLPALVVVGIDERMEGFLICNRMRKDPLLGRTPVVLLGSDATPRFSQLVRMHEGLRTRAADYVVGVERLGASVRRLLGV